MDLLKSSLFLIQVTWLVVAKKIPLNCMKSSVEAQEFQNLNCCSAREPDVSKYQTECNDYRTSVLYPDSKVLHTEDLMNACFLSCAWNLTGIMPNETTVNIDRLIAFFEDMVHDYALTKAMRPHARECVENYYDMISEWRSRGMFSISKDFRPRFDLRCSWAPLVISVCLEKKFITKCPAHRRRRTHKCILFKRFLNECTPTPVSANPKGLTVVEESN